MITTVNPDPSTPRRFSAPPPQADQLRQEGTRYRADRGVLKTPSEGNHPPRIRKTRAYIQKMVMKLAGDQLKGATAVVNLYSGNALGASVEQTGKDDAGRPIYEIGVTAGTLRKLQHEDELAFVLAHKLSGALGGPAIPWLSPDVRDMMTDKKAIEMMVKAGYNVDGALSALNRIFKQPAPGPVAPGDPIHPYEGVRVALDQLQIEQMRSTQPEARATAPMGPLPRDARLSIPARQSPPADDVDAAFTRMKDGCAPPQAAVDNVLKLLAGSESKAALNEQTIQDMSRYLLQNTCTDARPSGWHARAFIDTLGVQAPRFAANVLYNPRYQGVLAPLYGLNNEWKTLVDAAPGMLASDASEEAGWKRMTDEIVALAGRAPATPGRESGGTMSSRLDQVHRQNMLAFLQAAPLQKMASATTPDGQLQYLHNLRSVYFAPTTPYDHIFLDAVKQALDPGTRPFLQFRDQAAVDALRNPTRNTARTLTDYFVSAEALPLTDASRQTLSQPLIAFAQAANHQPEFFYDDPAGTGLHPLDTLPEMGRMLGGMLNRNVLSAAQRDDLFEFATSHHAFPQELPKTAATAKLLAPFISHVQNWSSGDVLQRVDAPWRQYDQSLATHLSTILGTPVDISRDGLQTLHDKLENGELQIPAPATAEDADKQRQATGYCRFILDKERDRRLSPLALAGYDPTVSANLVGRMTFDDVKHLIASSQAVLQRNQLASDLIGDSDIAPALSADAGRFLLDGLLAHGGQAPNLQSWYEAAAPLFDMSPILMDGRTDSRDRLESQMLAHLQKLSPPDVEGWLCKPHVMPLLRSDHLAGLVDKIATDNAQAKRICDKLELRTYYPEAFNKFRDDYTKRAQLQPHQLDEVFPEQDVSAQQMLHFKSDFENMAAIVARIRQESTVDQMAAIEYLMGRQQQVPEFLQKARSLDGSTPLIESVRQARHKLQTADVGARVLLVDSILAGPNSILHKPGGRDKLLGMLLKDIPKEQQSIAWRLSKALLDGQGESDSLVMAFVLGQKHEEKKDSATGAVGAAAPKTLSGGKVLSALFDAFGVPGEKLKQYLAFTGEFAQFRDDFAEAQDNARPLGYFNAIKLVQKRFNGQWPQRLQIKTVRGFGSVHVALQYYDPEARENRVLQIGRDQIETTAEYDFQRLKNLLAALTDTPEDKKSYGYLLGLVDIVHDSVRLEFDKRNEFHIQKQVQKLYHRTVNDWKVRTVDAYAVGNMSVFMGEALGESARKVFNSDPTAYREAMGALAQVETDVLFGIDERGLPCPVPLHANPDVHDGQALIDLKTKTVTLLDFGQALDISNKQREYAMDFLMVMGGAYGARGAANRLNKHAFPDGKGKLLTQDEMAEILSHEDKMDRFIHLLSLLNTKGHHVPLPVVHWILGANRQVALGKKVGFKAYQMLRNMVIVRRVGGPLVLYNALHLANRAIVNGLRSVFAAAHMGGVDGPWDQFVG